MDDYLLSEKEQWDALKRWVRENGPAVVAGVAIAALGLGGYRWWQAHQNNVALAAGAMYVRMENAFAQGNRTQAFILLGDLERQYPSSPYADQARLASAKAFVEDGELGRAAAELQDVMQHSHDPILRPVARLRLARVQTAEHKASEAIATLNAANPGALAPQYAEARGDAYYALGDKSAALAQYRMARATEGADAGNPASGGDTGLLDLKISDLVGEAQSAERGPGAQPPGKASGTAPAAPQGSKPVAQNPRKP